MGIRWAIAHHNQDIPMASENKPKATMAKNVETARIEVTAQQKAEIEAAWRICAQPGAKAIRSPQWSRRFDEVVANVLGFTPPARYTLVEAPART